MTEQEIGLLIVTLGAFICIVHVLGYIFERLRQPRLVGEILAGILLGPFVLGKISPGATDFLFANPSLGADKTKLILGFVYWMGLLLLMFSSGSQIRRLFSQENRRETAWILGVGTPLPFLLVMVLGLTSLLPLEPLTGEKNVPLATLLILASAVAVTSIPVISRIFNDLGILHTRFASLILGAAVLEDIALWGVLAVATALTQQNALSDQNLASSTSMHLVITMIYMAAALVVMPTILRAMRRNKYNVLYRASRIAYAVVIMFAYVGIAAYFSVNLVFAAFLAGFGLAGGVSGSDRPYFTEALDAISKFTFAIFTPIYFALVGYRLVFGREFSLVMLILFLVGSSVITMIFRSLAAKLAGFNRLDMVNIAVTSNARGGPGIVLASVAYDAGIISAAFYTTLVLTAIFTSQAAGLWLNYVLNKGWPLLSTDPDDKQIFPDKAPQAAQLH
jgi:Kef-type K+ transport system membrane component KefB